MRFVALALLMSGCSTVITARDSAHVDIVRGPPCVIRVYADGKLVSEVRWDKRCEVIVPEAQR